MMSRIHKSVLLSCRQTRTNSDVILKVINSATQAVHRCGCTQLPLAVVRTMSAKVPPSDFKVRSPYKNHGPRRFGYKQEIYDGGPIPELDRPKTSVPPVKKKVDRWSKEKALFGQNDYIDILGDGDVHPIHLISGPFWLVGFKGNEYQRLIRRLKMEGDYLKVNYPTEYDLIQKRLRYLYKKYNHKR